MTNRGKRVSSISLHVFCTRAELSSWLYVLCRERQYAGIAFIRESLSGVSLSADILETQSLYRIFLYRTPKEVPRDMRMNDVCARDWGWIDIRPGVLIEGDAGRVLTMTSIEAEDFESVGNHPVKDVKWLKRQMKGELVGGVRGRNTVTGGESTYRNIFYTPGALEELGRGTVWKHTEDDRAVFEPIAP
jgi:hypothetical protein